MKNQDITVTVTAKTYGVPEDYSFDLQCPDPESLEEFVELCAGDEKAAVECGMSGWRVKAQTRARQAVASAAVPGEDSEEDPITDPGKLHELAQQALSEFRYTGRPEPKPKTKTKISREALAEKAKEHGLTSNQLKGMDALMELLQGEGIEVTD